MGEYDAIMKRVIENGECYEVVKDGKLVAVIIDAGRYERLKSAVRGLSAKRGLAR